MLKHETHSNTNCDTGESSITGVYTLNGCIISEFDGEKFVDINEDVAEQNHRSAFLNDPALDRLDKIVDVITRGLFK